MLPQLIQVLDLIELLAMLLGVTLISEFMCHASSSSPFGPLLYPCLLFACHYSISKYWFFYVSDSLASSPKFHGMVGGELEG